jgi:hypothetical protein
VQKCTLDNQAIHEMQEEAQKERHSSGTGTSPAMATNDLDAKSASGGAVVA